MPTGTALHFAFLVISVLIAFDFYIMLISPLREQTKKNEHSNDGYQIRGLS